MKNGGSRGKTEVTRETCVDYRDLSVKNGEICPAKADQHRWGIFGTDVTKNQQIRAPTVQDFLAVRSPDFIMNSIVYFHISCPRHGCWPEGRLRELFCRWTAKYPMRWTCQSIPSGNRIMEQFIDDLPTLMLIFKGDFQATMFDDPQKAWLSQKELLDQPLPLFGRWGSPKHSGWLVTFRIYPVIITLICTQWIYPMYIQHTPNSRESAAGRVGGQRICRDRWELQGEGEG